MVPMPIRTGIFEMAVVLAAARWHQAHGDTPGPRHAAAVDEAEADREAEQSADRLHEAVAALQAEYDRQDQERKAS